MLRIFRLMMLVLPVAGAIGLSSRLVAGAEGPARDPAQALAPAVTVVEVTRQALAPTARGWGNVRAERTWTAIAEVRGAVVWRNPDLEVGRPVRAGTELLRLDPSDYQLAITQAEADLASLQAELGQIAAEEANTARILELEQARLAISESDAARTRELVAQGTAAAARADDAERAVLASRRVVVELQNAQALYPSRRERNAAQIARTEAALARARRDLDHTRITTPFDMRITQAPVEQYQFVAVGQVLAAGDGFEAVEVVTQLPVSAFRRVVSGVVVPDGDLVEFPRQAAQAIDVTLWPVIAPDEHWPGRITRVEGALDPRARTAQVVVGVNDPYGDASAATRLPLVPNLQVEVVLSAPEVPDLIVIPETALHGDAVYVLDAQSQLVVQPVSIAFRQDGLAVIASGLEGGERLILDDVAPAIPGMALTGVAP